MALRRTFATPLLFTLASSLGLTFACGSGSDAAPSAPIDSAAAVRPDAPDASQTGTDGANGDGATDAHPAVGDAAVPQEDAGPPAVRFIGRFDTRNAAAPVCGFPGCRIVANFSGTGVKVRLEENVEAWMEGGPSEWDVTIDGVLQPKLVLELGAKDYVLASGLPAGPHTVELYKRSESQNGVTTFLGYDFGSGTLLPPPLPATRRIEIVGDSAAAGFGIEGVGLGPDCPGPDWSAHWQNFHKAFGALLGEALSADLNATIYSGKGLVRNIWRSDPVTMPIVYKRANPIDQSSVFDLSSFVPDVIVMMMGGNDFALGQPEDNGPTPLPEFTQATRDMVTTFRSYAPQAHVFLVVSPSVSDDAPPGRQSRTNVTTAFDTVASERAAAADPRVYSVAPPIAPASELTGCNGHGNPAFHVRVAEQLGVMVKQKTGW
jgi:lysophospholipase L1-like esterase